MGKNDAVPLDVHVIRIANRDYNLGRKEKGISKKEYSEIADTLKAKWGPDAGWVQTVLFYREVQMSKAPNKPKAKKRQKKETVKIENSKQLIVLQDTKNVKVEKLKKSAPKKRIKKEVGNETRKMTKPLETKSEIDHGKSVKTKIKLEI